MFGNYILAWDPLGYQNEEPSPQCLMRVKRDIADFDAKPPAGLFIAPDEEDVTRIHALVVGPGGTPYEGGFFQFFMRFPSDYPLSPPRVRIMTTDAGRVRFNPNLYACGRVCLSILGTWTGPPWSPAQCLESVLISVQSLMTEKPYYNEPGVVKERTPGEADRYGDYIQHETIRVAVCDQVEAALKESPDCPAVFREQIIKSFSESYTRYEEIVKGKLHLTGTEMKDCFSLNVTGHFQYEALLARMEGLKEQIKQKSEATAAAAAAEAAAEAAVAVTAATNTDILQ
ncbi:ubiquitin-conjugating enzyme E2 Z-like [Dermacentor albipictus]|uniref:ubiquitin-conjugating enzyme E2 Z-like n=1 Tax=Dermacentor albipictus TaxID=60249 RepID=UPI0031FC4FA6